MPKPNPLKLSDCRPGAQMAVYIPGVRRPLFGVVIRAWRERSGVRVQLSIYRDGKQATVEVDVDQIVPW